MTNVEPEPETTTETETNSATTAGAVTMPAVPTVPLYRPGQDSGLLFVTFDAVAETEGIGLASREEPRHGYDPTYQLIECPVCGQRFAGRNRRYALEDGWMDYDHHFNTRHVGEKWATVTVTATPRAGLNTSAIGKHFRRHVDLDRARLLDFSQIDSESYRPSYEATFELGRWRGDIPNAELARYIRDAIAFDEFDDLEIDWHHRPPVQAGYEREAVEAARNGRHRDANATAATDGGDDP